MATTLESFERAVQIAHCLMPKIIGCWTGRNLHGTFFQGKLGSQHNRGYFAFLQVLVRSKKSLLLVENIITRSSRSDKLGVRKPRNRSRRGRFQNYILVIRIGCEKESGKNSFNVWLSQCSRKCQCFTQVSSSCIMLYSN